MSNQQQPLQRYFRPGQALFKEGESSSSIFIIRRGTIAVRKRKGDGYVEVSRLYTNEVLGELSFFDRQPRSATAVALTEVEVMEITFDALDRIYKTIPDYMRTIVASMAERLRKASETISKLQKDTVDDKGGPEPSKLDTSAADALAASVEVDFDDPSSEDGE